MKLFLSGLTEPVVTVCYVANSAGQPVEVDYEQLVKSAQGTDPFSVPADATPPQITICRTCSARGS